MSTTAAMPRLTSLSHGAGCACKLSLDELTDALAQVAWPGHPDLLVGHERGDDAAVWRQGDGRALAATTDFFTPLVDDPADWGRIAAANAVSDVYAMGARPLFALNLVGWPRDLPAEGLSAVLAGALEIAREGGYPVAGGHSIDSAEPLYGQVVIGEVAEDALLTNAGGAAGDALVLTKPLGTGIVTTAHKRTAPLDELADDHPVAEAYRAAVASMTRRNDEASRAALAAGARAATDVTGFGLLGHLHRLAAASGVAAELDAGAVPVLPGAAALLDAGHVPGGSRRNAEQADAYLIGEVAERTRLLLADAQTSGGLLVAVAPRAADDLVAGLVATGHVAARVGRLTAGAPGAVRVT